MLSYRDSVNPADDFIRSQNLPELWSNTKKLSITVKQQVAPLQANEVMNIQRKSASFDVAQHKFREKFRRLEGFKFDCEEPYQILDDVRIIRFRDAMCYLSLTALTFSLSLSLPLSLSLSLSLTHTHTHTHARTHTHTHTHSTLRQSLRAIIFTATKLSLPFKSKRKGNYSVSTNRTLFFGPLRSTELFRARRKNVQR